MQGIKNDVIDVNASDISNEFILRGVRKTGKTVHKIYDNQKIAEFEFDLTSTVAIELTLSIVVNEIEAVYKTFENTDYIKNVLLKDDKKKNKK